jgi:hypothetical protein
MRPRRVVTLYEGFETTVQPFVEAEIGPQPRQLLLTMLGAVFFVLLIACVNVANLLIDRAAHKSREIGIRAALGARRGTIIGQFLSETDRLQAVGAVYQADRIRWRAVTYSFNATLPLYCRDCSSGSRHRLVACARHGGPECRDRGAETVPHESDRSLGVSVACRDCEHDRNEANYGSNVLTKHGCCRHNAPVQRRAAQRTGMLLQFRRQWLFYNIRRSKAIGEW